MSDPWAAVGAVSAALGGVALVLRGLRNSRYVRQRTQTRSNMQTFLLDWLGETPRPGFEGRPSFPERMSQVERRTQLLQHDFATETVSRLTLIGSSVDEIKEQSSETTKAVARMDYRINGLDQRIGDHKRRNEETAERLATAIAEQQARAAAIEQRLMHISDDLLRAETMRAALLELGIPIDPPAHPQP